MLRMTTRGALTQCRLKHELVSSGAFKVINMKNGVQFQALDVEDFPRLWKSTHEETLARPKSEPLGNAGKTNA